MKYNVKPRSRYTTNPAGKNHESGRKRSGFLRDANQDGIRRRAYNELK
jgi:hypothetical protein